MMMMMTGHVRPRALVVHVPLAPSSSNYTCELSIVGGGGDKSGIKEGKNKGNKKRNTVTSWQFKCFFFRGRTMELTEAAAANNANKICVTSTKS